MNQHSIPAVAAARTVHAASGRIEVAHAKGGEETSVEQAIANVAQRTSVDFDFLMAQAQVESAMDPAARASGSSATGLYQFIESTWLETMQRHGPRFGLSDVAAQVADPAQRDAILAMRSDPETAALMAAGLAEDNRAHLAPILGREPRDNELYLAHFLGAGGAGHFVTAMAQDSTQIAAKLFQRPAAANRAVFYEPGGAPRTLEGVMRHLTNRLEQAGTQAARGNDVPRPLLALETASAGAALTTGPMTHSSYTRMRPTMAMRPAVLSPPPSTSRQPMSNLLKTAFDGAEAVASPEAARQIRSAYDQFRAAGL